MTTLAKQLAGALAAALDCMSHAAQTEREMANAALARYRQSNDYRREQIDEGIRSASTIANKLDDDLQELLATNISLLTDSEEILLRNARELIAEAADHINKILDPDA